MDNEAASPKRKLIEVALPLEAINRESSREKSIRHGHPSTLHLWWARRPLAAARAVLFAQLVDDPSSRPEEFPTEESQRRERDRLHGIIERLVIWDNIRDEKLLAEARSEIIKSTGGNPPSILDPFAGGGTIPLEAQRLGLNAFASDLNPVAVLINKALIEIPPMYRDKPPVFPGLAASEIRSWKGAEGLAADVRAYGAWMSAAAQKRIGHLYPQTRLPEGANAPVIAWIWARTVACPNPACGIELPLMRTWWLSKKKNKEAYLCPSVIDDSSALSNSKRRVEFHIGYDLRHAPQQAADGTVKRGNGSCVACSADVPNGYIRSQAKSRGLGYRMIAVVAERNRQRVFVIPSHDDEAAARVDAPQDVPDQLVPTRNHDVDRLPMYGMPRWSDAFTHRQLTALATFSDLVTDARDRVSADSGSADYADAVATYLGLGVSRLADIANTLCSWENTKTQVRHLFTRQAIQMLWDFAEAPPFGKAAGSFEVSLGSLSKAIVDTGGRRATVTQDDASTRSYEGLLVSTDPPYYDNIGYSDLSDFFYVWLRRTLRSVYPKLFSTMVTPKAEELVANPYRHGGSDGAKSFFEDGFRRVFARVRETADGKYPITVYYAFKQTEIGESGESSTGWETLLEGMIGSGWEITSTWPLRSELANRMMASGTNALASSIVLSLRPRAESATTTDRRGFIASLEQELPGALRKLQQGQIAPVDLPQAAIGPGMAVFSRYTAVLEPDGTRMTVSAALSRINETLDRVLNEQEGDFDPTSRFAIAWYRQHGYDSGKFGDADNLARARNTSVEIMVRDGVLTSRAGTVQLLRPAELSPEYSVASDLHTSNWEALQHLIRLLDSDGIPAAGEFLQTAVRRADSAIERDLVKELSHLLFRIAEGNGWVRDALLFNNLVTSWPDILDVATADRNLSSAQSAFDFDEGED
jgi:putative DNA methylase